MTEHRKIVLIENEPINRMLTADLLRSEGYDVISERTAAGGIEKTISEQPNLIITDTSLPDMDGLDIVRVLKGNDETKDIPVVAIMDELTQAASREAMLAGCVGCMTKRYTFPFGVMSPSTFIRILYSFMPPSAVPEVRIDKRSRLSKATAKACAAFAKALVSLRRSYPEGALVELNDGSVCIVRKQNAEFMLRPIVELIMDKDGGHPKTPVMIDLYATSVLAITHVVSEDGSGTAGS